MILITGGAGYIGSHINKIITSQGYETIVVDNLSNGHKEFVKWGLFYEVDLRDELQLSAVFERHEIEAVIHLAAYAYVGESVGNPQKYNNNNIISTLSLLNVMLKYNVKNIIFSSTCAVYGVPHSLPITENNPLTPINPYGETKAFIEKVLKQYHKSYNLNYISLRYFNVAGGDFDCDIGEFHEPETHLIPIALNKAYNQESIDIFGDDYDTNDGTCIRDYIHVLDLADAHILALKHLLKTQESDVFNLGTEHGYSNLDIIKSIENILDSKIKINFSQRREGDPDKLVASNRKAKEILNWEPKYSDINVIIESAWKWYKKQNKLTR